MKLQRIMMLSLGAILVGTAPGLLRAKEPRMGRGYDTSSKEWIERRVENLTQGVNLTPEQQTQVRKILQERAERIKPMAEQMRIIHQESEAKIMALMTEEQRKKFQETKPQRQDTMRKGMAPKSDAKP